MSAEVSVVDYGANNLHSIVHALEINNARVKIAKTPEDIRRSERLVIPGVGAFPEGKKNLVADGVFDELLLYSEKERPLLGICLGMQMLATRSYEFGNTTGLNLIPGQVVNIPDRDLDGGRLKRPHIGWAKVLPNKDTSWSSSILDEIPEGTEFYMVHSFHLIPEIISDVLAVTQYGGHTITAAVKRRHVIGCQFHPEKSGKHGIKVLNSFLKL